MWPTLLLRTGFRLQLLWERCALPHDERLRRACARGDLREAQRLVQKGANRCAPRPRPPSADFLTPSHRTPLHVAALCGHPHVVAWLLEAGADPLAFDRPRADTPAHLATGQLSNGSDGDPQPFREVLGLLWQAQPRCFLQRNRFERSALNELPEGYNEQHLAAWGLAYSLASGLSPPETKPARRRL